MFGWFANNAAPAGKELYDAVKRGNLGVVEKLLEKATAKDINWTGNVRFCCFKKLLLF